MKVKALKDGFYGDRIQRKGSVFILAPRKTKGVDEKGKPVVLSVDQQFSSKWMEKVTETKKQ